MPAGCALTIEVRGRLSAILNGRLDIVVPVSCCRDGLNPRVEQGPTFVGRACPPRIVKGAGDVMSLLEQLAREAAQSKDFEPGAVKRDLAHRLRVERLLRARLRACLAYFEKFKQHLETLAPTLSTSYEVRGVGRLEGLTQGGYSLFADDIPEKMTRFSFKCIYRGDTEIQAEVTQASTTESIREYLENHRLKYKLITPANRPNQFTVRGFVTMGFEFSADVEQEKIRLDMRNVESLADDTHRFGASDLDRTFMDEIARCVLHKPHRLRALTGNQLTDTTRLRFQEKIEESRRQRVEEEESARRRAAEAETTKVRPSLGLRLGLDKFRKPRS